MAGGGRTGAWSAKTNDKGQWIQVNLGKIMEVSKTGIQGRQDYAQWVTKYRVSYSTDGQHFTVQNQVGTYKQKKQKHKFICKSMPSHCFVSVKLPFWREKNVTTLDTFYIVLYFQICFLHLNTQLRCLALQVGMCQNIIEHTRTLQGD